MTEARWVLLHGAPLTPSAWNGVRDHLGHDAVAPDLNRHVSSAPLGMVLQRGIAAAVLDEVKDELLILVGHSLGGQVAMEMALLAPHRVRRLLLVCTRDTPVPEFRRAASALRSAVPLDVDATLRRWFTAAEVADDGAVVRYARHELRATPPERYATMLEALATYDGRRYVAKITAPAVLLCGRLDLGCTPAVMTTLANDLPHAILHTVDEWAHMSPFTHPAAFATRLMTAATESFLP